MGTGLPAASSRNTCFSRSDERSQVDPGDLMRLCCRGEIKNRNENSWTQLIAPGASPSSYATAPVWLSLPQLNEICGSKVKGGVCTSTNAKLPQSAGLVFSALQQQTWVPWVCLLLKPADNKKWTSILIVAPALIGRAGTAEADLEPIRNGNTHRKPGFEG